MPESQLPRRAYFAAEDHAPLDPNASPARISQQQVAIAARNTLAQNLIYKAEQIAAAVKTARTFDTTGQIPAALPHLAISVADLVKAHEAFVDDVARSLEKHARRARMERGLNIAAAAETAHPAGAGRALDQQILTESITAISAAAHDDAASALAAVDAAEETAGAPSAAKPGPRA
jgi:hypothetical protein